MEKSHIKLIEDLIRAQGESLEIHDALWQEKPVSPVTFFEKFLHEACYPEQQKFVDAVLGQNGEEWDIKYDEAIALCGKGSGKDRTIAKILTYCIYKLLCMRNPQRFLGLNDTDIDGPESAIDIGNVSLNARLAKDVFFKNFVAMIKSTTNPKTGNNWFEEHGLHFQKDILTREIKFPKGITAYSLDSEEYTGEGLNLLVIVFDEVGGFEPKKADDLYRALVSTQKTRFGNKRKTLLLSYKRNDNDFMMIRYQQAAEEKRTFRVKAATWIWNIKRSKDDFIEDYVKNPEDSKRVYECEGSTAEEGYFKYKQRIKEIINPNRVNPTQKNLWWTDDILKLKFKDFFAPLKNERYFIHVDLAKGKLSGDYGGFALGHAVRNQSIKLSEEYIKSLIQAEGFGITKVIDQKQPAVVIDLVLQLRARPGQEIIFDEIRQFIQSLRRVGFFVQETTFDGWQSTDSIQLLKKSGINAEVQSVDRNTEAYDTLKEQIYKGLLDIYQHPTFIRECEELIRTNSSKVDHPEFSYRRSVEEGRMAGSKDVSDAVAGCVNLCIKNAKSCFSFGVSGSTDRKNNKRKPDDDNPDKLVFYGQRH